MSDPGPKNVDWKLKVFAKHWLNDPIPQGLMNDLCEILEDENYPPEKRAHQIVWQAIKYGMGREKPERIHRGKADE